MSSADLLLPSDEYNRTFFDRITPGGNPHVLTRNQLLDVLWANGVKRPFLPGAGSRLLLSIPGRPQINICPTKRGRRSVYYVTIPAPV